MRIVKCRKGRLSLARFPERSKGTDLRSVALASWVRIPHRALVLIAQLVRASVL